MLTIDDYEENTYDPREFIEDTIWHHNATARTNVTKVGIPDTDNDGYSGDRYCGNDGYSGLNPPDDAILFTVSGITAIADKKLRFS